MYVSFIPEEAENHFPPKYDLSYSNFPADQAKGLRKPVTQRTLSLTRRTVPRMTVLNGMFFFLIINQVINITIIIIIINIMIITIIIIIINSHNDKLLTKQLSVGSLPE